MGNGQPFMYDAVPKDNSRSPYHAFDPKAVSRASLTPNIQRPKSEGPLVSFNVHPDYYFQPPYGNINATPMGKSSKKRIVQTRWAQLAIRVIELLGAAGSLAVFVMISGIETSTGWILRIAPGVAILNVSYAIYHLSRKASARTPASSGSYMVFAAAFDAAVIPFYAYSAYMAALQHKMLEAGTDQPGQWTTLLPQGNIVMPTLIGTAFLSTAITGGLHMISLALSIYLCVMFRKILDLPPDMNPLEDNLTARPHKRNKSELSNMSTSTLTEYEKRISMPMESRRNSGAPYEDVSRSPTIPFLHTRLGSTESLSASRSRDSGIDLGSRQYQIQPGNVSVTSLPLKRATMTQNTPPSSPLKYSAYAEVPIDEIDVPLQSSPLKEAWFKTDLIANDDNPYPKMGGHGRSSPPKKSHAGAYEPLHHRNLSADLSDQTFPYPQPNGLRQNPSPRLPQHQSPKPVGIPPAFTHAQTSPSGTGRSSQISNSPKTSPTRKPPGTELANSPKISLETTFIKPHSPAAIPTRALLHNPFIGGNTSPIRSRPLTDLPASTTNIRKTSSNYSGDLADASVSDVSSVSSYNRHSTYGSLANSLYATNSVSTRSKTPIPGKSFATNNNGPEPRSYTFTSDASAIPPSLSEQLARNGVGIRDDISVSSASSVSKFKAKGYGDLRAATPPLIIGRDSVDLSRRQASSGNDWNDNMGGFKKRQASGKMVEEGLAGWTGRLRKISGMGGVER